MKDGPLVASVAALIGDPARANMLTALMDGRALTTGELAHEAGVAMQTASGHLTKLKSANLVAVEQQGRHRYYRLSDPDVAYAIEVLTGLAQRTGAVRTRPGPKDEALRRSRVCYDHLAGERGVALFDRIKGNGLISGADTPHITPLGRDYFIGFGIDVPALEKSRRPLCRHCLDWSERRHHLGGALGAAILSQIVTRGWASRDTGRTLVFSDAGLRAFQAAFGL